MTKNIAVVALLAAIATLGAIVAACGGESPPANSPSSASPADTSSAAPAGTGSAASNVEEIHRCRRDGADQVAEPHVFDGLPRRNVEGRKRAGRDDARVVSGE